MDFKKCWVKLNIGNDILILYLHKNYFYFHICSSLIKFLFFKPNIPYLSLFLNFSLQYSPIFFPVCINKIFN